MNRRTVLKFLGLGSLIGAGYVAGSDDLQINPTDFIQSGGDGDTSLKEYKQEVEQQAADISHQPPQLSFEYEPVDTTVESDFIDKINAEPLSDQRGDRVLLQPGALSHAELRDEVLIIQGAAIDPVGGIKIGPEQVRLYGGDRRGLAVVAGVWETADGVILGRAENFSVATNAVENADSLL